MILDADVLIELVRERPEAEAWLDSVPELPLVAGVAAMELVYGARNKEEQRKVSRFFDTFTLVWPTDADLQHAYEVFIPLGLVHGNGILDSMVAATAVGLGEPVATFNLKHFGKLPGVTTVQPYTRT